MMQLKHQQTLSPFPSTLKILAVTWNLVGSVPQEKYLSQFFGCKHFKQQPDIIFIGTQQCQISLFWAFFWDSKSLWEENLRIYLKQYQLFSTYSLQGLHNAVLIHKSHKQNTYLINRQLLRAGFFCNLFGNKGAISIKIKIHGQYIQFINCHLAPHQDNNKQRNQTLIRIVNKLVCKQTQTQVILLGDMNYRIQMKKYDYKKHFNKQILNTQQNMQYSKRFIEDQQLRNQQQLKDNFFPFFEEYQINFPPTYKLGLQSNQYNKQRVPGWTDRIFNRKGKIRRQNYQCRYSNYGSDHRPVLSLFQLDMEQGISIFQNQTFETESCQLI